MRPDRVRWDSKPPELEIRIKSPDTDIRIAALRLTVAELENVIANAISSDFRSKGKHAPLFSTRYGIARRVTLQLAQIAQLRRRDIDAST